MTDEATVDRVHPSSDPVELLTFLRRPLSAAPDIVPRIVLRRGLTVIRASPLDGLMLALNLTLARSAGLPWLGRPTAPGITLVLTVADKDELTWRVRAMRRALTQPAVPDSVFLMPDRGCKPDTPAGLEALTAALEVSRADCLVLDSAVRLRSGPMLGLVSAIDALIQRHHLAVVITHHRGGGRETRALLDAAQRVVSLEQDGAGWMLEAGRPDNPALIDRLPMTRARDTHWFTPFTATPAVPNSAASSAPEPTPAKAGV